MRGLHFLLLLPLLALCACNTPSSKLPEVSDAELHEEQVIQQRMIDEAAKTGGNPRPWRKAEKMSKRFVAMAEKLEPIAAQVCQEMGLPKLKRRCYFYFRLKMGDEINAYADGDQIIFKYGMMRFVENDDELALVMGHEIAHNLMGHIKAQKENAIAGEFLGAMFDVADDGYTGMRSKEWGDGGAALGALTYSAAFEAEADYVGLYITARAGYDVRRAMQIWRRLSIESPETMYITITHPTNAKRFALLKKAIEEIEYKKQQRLPLTPDLVKDPIEGDYEPKTLFEYMLQ